MNNNTTIAPGLPILTIVGVILLAIVPPASIVFFVAAGISQRNFNRRVRRIRAEAYVAAHQRLQREQFTAVGTFLR